ncbi:hypothetical protein [Kribbella sp. NPDC023855]|uniref:hypothetical protein n=1 Tax=Kribbella sp. NPDC023855 TaxID=3154698 RepID=UPI0033F522FD
MFEGIAHLAEGLAFGLRRAVEVLLPHEDEQRQRGQHHPGTGQQHRQAQTQQAERAGGDDADDPAGELDLLGPDEDRRDLLLADLVGDSGLVGAGGEGEAETPQHLRGENREERRHQPLQQETRADEGEADDDGQPPAVEVGDDAGRDLEQEAGDFERRSDQDELQWAEADSLLKAARVRA